MVSTVLLVLGSFVLAGLAFLALVLRIGFPHHRKLAVGLYLAGWVPFVAAVLQHQAMLERESAAVTGALSTYGPLVGAAFALAATGWAAMVLFPVTPAVIASLDEPTLDAEIDHDLALLRTMIDHNDRALDALDDSGLLSGPGQGLSADERADLRALWERLVETSFELDVLGRRYRAFTQIDPLARPRAHARAFLMAYASFVEQFATGVQLEAAVGDDSVLHTLLDEEGREIPAGSLTAIQRRSIEPDTLLRLNAGRAYLRLMAGRLEPERELVDIVRERLNAVDRVVTDRPEVLLDNPLDVLERKALSLWFPAQKGVARQMSHVRIERPYLITSAIIAAHRHQLEPGDILLERREWCLTNLGIPGYWTHAALHVGTLAQLDEFFAGKALPDHSPTVSEYLRRAMPAVFEALSRTEEQGHTPSVIEALGDGVVITSLERTSDADSIAALRVNTSTGRKLAAVLEALSHFGKPYDYDFDFTTDSAIVCSELVWRAYEGTPELHLETELMNGRVLLSPNSLAQKFDEEADGPSPELSLALFLDGEASGGVIEKDAAAFRDTWKRAKWHILFT